MHDLSSNQSYKGKQCVSHSKSNSDSTCEDKPNAIPKETDDKKQKVKKWLESQYKNMIKEMEIEKWLESQYKNMKKEMEILSSEAVEDEDLFYVSNSDDKKSSAIYEETEYPKQKEEEWLERQYKNMKMDIQVLLNEAVEDEDLFFDPDSED